MCPPSHHPRRRVPPRSNDRQGVQGCSGIDLAAGEGNADRASDDPQLVLPAPGRLPQGAGVAEHPLAVFGVKLPFSRRFVAGVRIVISWIMPGLLHLGITRVSPILVCLHAYKVVLANWSRHVALIADTSVVRFRHVPLGVCREFHAPLVNLVVNKSVRVDFALYSVCHIFRPLERFPMS